MTVSPAAQAGPLADRELGLIDAYWRASNYLSVGQIYLLANPLLREPLRLDAERLGAARVGSVQMVPRAAT